MPGRASTGVSSQRMKTAGIVGGIGPESTIEYYRHIHNTYMGELVKGILLPETREQLLAIAERLRVEEGIEAMILGGTELPLICVIRIMKQCLFWIRPGCMWSKLSSSFVPNRSAVDAAQNKAVMLQTAAKPFEPRRRSLDEGPVFFLPADHQY